MHRARPHVDWIGCSSPGFFIACRTVGFDTPGQSATVEIKDAGTDPLEIWDQIFKGRLVIE